MGYCSAVDSTDGFFSTCFEHFTEGYGHCKITLHILYATAVLLPSLARMLCGMIQLVRLRTLL